MRRGDAVPRGTDRTALGQGAGLKRGQNVIWAQPMAHPAGSAGPLPDGARGCTLYWPGMRTCCLLPVPRLFAALCDHTVMKFALPSDLKT